MPNPAPANNLFNIDEQVVATMIADRRFSSAFPCVAQAGRRLAGLDAACQTCAARRAQKPKNQLTIYREVLQCLGSMGDRDKVKLLRLLDARQFRLIKRNARGEEMVYTFKG